MRIYSLDEALLVSPDSVYSIDLSRKKLSVLPAELFRFRSLKTLNLSKNKLSSLGDSLSLFTQLESINISSNKFEALPSILFKLDRLRYLFASKNDITSIQNEIQYLYDNPIADIGTGLQQLNELEKLDLQGVMYGPSFHKFILTSLPHVQVKMDPPCSCME